MSNFTEATVSDQKRLVRGEHWLLTRTLLRKRDERHHLPWRVLMIAGGSPRGEIVAIREVMPKAYIVAADIDQECLSAADSADETVCCDLLESIKSKGTTSVPAVMYERERFDAINLDFCGPVSRELSRMVGMYLRTALTSRGVLMVTFSYGRDVAEMFVGRERKFLVDVSSCSYRKEQEWRELPQEIPDTIAGRISYLGNLEYLESVMSYKGNEMPMCSLLFQKGIEEMRRRQRISYTKVDPDDFGLAVVYPDAASLYDCPAERIQSFRNHFAAMKAVATRKARMALSSDDGVPT